MARPLRLALTGSRGVLGSRISEAAARGGHSVNAFSGDVRDRGLLRSWLAAATPDCVIHAAARVPVTTVESDIPGAIDVNVAGTAAVAEACARAGARLVYISTSHVYAPARAPIAEDHELAPSTSYGLTKLQGERWCEALTDDHLIIRLFSYFDARQPTTFLVPGLVSRISGCPPEAAVEVRGASNVRDMADASWHAEAILALIDAGADGTVNCGTGNGLTVAELATRIASTLGRDDVVLTPVDAERPNSLVARTDLLRARVPGLRDFALDTALRSLRAGSGAS